jgi:hypothetical protein
MSVVRAGMPESARGRHFALAGAKQTRRVYPNRTESASEACAPLKKGKAIFHGSGSRSVLDSRSWARNLA